MKRKYVIKDIDALKKSRSEAAFKKKKRNLIATETFCQTVHRIRVIFNNDLKRDGKILASLHTFNYYEEAIYNLIKKEYFIHQMMKEVEKNIEEAKFRGDL